MQATSRTRRVLAALVIVLVAATLVGATAWNPARPAPVPAPAARFDAPGPLVGTFTGRFDTGVPVYSLPRIAVTASRSAELARMAQEEQFAMQ